MAPHFGFLKKLVRDLNESNKIDKCEELKNKMRICLTDERKQHNCLEIMHQYYNCKDLKKEKNKSFSYLHFYK